MGRTKKEEPTLDLEEATVLDYEVVDKEPVKEVAEGHTLADTFKCEVTKEILFWLDAKHVDVTERQLVKAGTELEMPIELLERLKPYVKIID